MVSWTEMLNKNTGEGIVEPEYMQRPPLDALPDIQNPNLEPPRISIDPLAVDWEIIGAYELRRGVALLTTGLTANSSKPKSGGLISRA